MQVLFFADTVAAAGFSVWKLADSTKYTLWTGIIIYVLGMLFIGWWCSKKVKGMNDFLVAGRRLPLWMATATLLATWFGAGSSMGVAATVYTDGIGGVLSDPFGASLSLIIAGIFVVGLLRKLKCLTVTDIIERRYGKWAGVYASLWMIPVYIGWLGAQILGIGTLLNLLTGINAKLGTCIGAVIVLIYTLEGGMWAVTITDVVQVSFIIFGLFLIIPGAISECGSWDAMMSRVSEADLSLGFKGQGATDFVYYIGTWIVMGLGCVVGQDVIQRSLSSRNDKIAVSSAVISGFFYMAIGLVPITIGLAARAVFAKYGISAESFGGDLENGVLPQMAMIVLGNISPVLLTIFLAALISAIMSSADSSLLAASSLLCNNVVGSIWPRLKDKYLLLITRIATVALTVLALVLAYYVDSIYKLMINSWASQLVVVFIPVCTALYVKNAGKNAAWATMAVSTATWLTYTFITSSGSGMCFNELLNSDLLDYNLTVGAVYGFAAGLIAFICCYFGERIPGWVLDTGNTDDEEE